MPFLLISVPRLGSKLVSACFLCALPPLFPLSAAFAANASSIASICMLSAPLPCVVSPPQYPYLRVPASFGKSLLSSFLYQSVCLSPFLFLLIASPCHFCLYLYFVSFSLLLRCVLRAFPCLLRHLYIALSLSHSTLRHCSLCLFLSFFPSFCRFHSSLDNSLSGRNTAEVFYLFPVLVFEVYVHVCLYPCAFPICSLFPLTCVEFLLICCCTSVGAPFLSPVVAAS